MVRITCGCTVQGPGKTCEHGKKLFAKASQALESLTGKTPAQMGDERWVAYRLAHLVYLDHLRGWWEGDIKVQRGRDGWVIFLRYGGRWIVHFGTADESLVREWLSLRGYQQFVGKGEQAADHLSGYYRKGEGNTFIAEKVPLLHAPEALAASGEFAGTSSHIDLKTRIAISIALQIARLPHSPTIMERVSMRRSIAMLLRRDGVTVGPQEERLLWELIEETVQQKEHYANLPVRSTQPLQP